MPTVPFSYPAQAILLPVTSLNFGDRTRTDYPNLQELADSISSGGLIHPPTVNLENKLIAGGRRCRAMIDVLKVDHIPVVVLETADEAHLAYLEDQENYTRVNPPWYDRVRGIARIHSHKALESALARNGKWTVSMTGSLLGMSQASVSNALLLLPLINSGDEEILSCPTLTEALRIVIERKEKQAAASLMVTNLPTITPSTKPALPPAQTRSIPDDDSALAGMMDMFGFGLSGVSPTQPAAIPAPTQVQGGPLTPSQTGASGAPLTQSPEPAPAPAKKSDSIDFSKLVYCADSIQWMHDHYESVDHIVTDIPYGIEMKNLQQQNTGMDVSSTAKEHDVDYNLDLFHRMFPAMFSCLKPNGFAVLFCDMQHWWTLAELAEAAGFKVQRWPLIWNKSYPCLNQSATYNFTKNFEVALVLRKGNATLINPQASSVFTCANPDKDFYNHPFAKPNALWDWIYTAITIQGQTVLDPFAGSGSASCAALARGLKPIAVELVPEHVSNIVYNLARTIDRIA